MLAASSPPSSATGVGKSIELIAECLVLASGQNWLGTIPRERVRVGYWNGDDPYVELERRFHAVCEHHGLDLKALIEKGWLYLGTRDKQPLYIASAGHNRVIIDQDTAADIEAFIRARDRVFGLRPTQIARKRRKKGRKKAGSALGGFDQALDLALS